MIEYKRLKDLMEQHDELQIILGVSEWAYDDCVWSLLEPYKVSSKVVLRVVDAVMDARAAVEGMISGSVSTAVKCDGEYVRLTVCNDGTWHLETTVRPDYNYPAYAAAHSDAAVLCWEHNGEVIVIPPEALTVEQFGDPSSDEEPHCDSDRAQFIQLDYSDAAKAVNDRLRELHMTAKAEGLGVALAWYEALVHYKLIPVSAEALREWIEHTAPDDPGAELPYEEYVGVMMLEEV